MGVQGACKTGFQRMICLTHLHGSRIVRARIQARSDSARIVWTEAPAMISSAQLSQLSARCAALLALAGTCVLAGCGAGSVPGPGSQVISSAVSNGPQLGYLWDAADQTLRPVLGVPGSSQFGQSVTLPRGCTSTARLRAQRIGAVARCGRLAEQDGAALRHGADCSGREFQGSSADHLLALRTDAILFSPGGASVLLVTGLGASAQVQTLTAPTALLSAAVSDTAQVAAVSGSGPLSVALLTGNRSSLGPLAGFGGAGFLPGGTTCCWQTAPRAW
jgi:hypothetical protein